MDAFSKLMAKGLVDTNYNLFVRHANVDICVSFLNFWFIPRLIWL